MKTKLEGFLLMACVVLVLLSGTLIFLVLMPDNEITIKPIIISTNVPNSKKFKDTHSDFWEDCVNIGDGTYYFNVLFSQNLVMRNDAKSDSMRGCEVLLEKISHKFENQIFYGYFKDGFAIVYPESNLCKVLRVSRPDYYEGRSFDYDTCEDGSYIIRKAEPEDESKKKFIIYLDSFDEYTEYEQKMLNSLVEKSKEG